MSWKGRGSLAKECDDMGWIWGSFSIVTGVVLATKIFDCYRLQDAIVVRCELQYSFFIFYTLMLALQIFWTERATRLVRSIQCYLFKFLFRLAPLNDDLRFVGLRVCRPCDASSRSQCSLCGNAASARTTQSRCEQQFIEVMSIDVCWAFLHHAGGLLWEMWPLRSKRRLSIHLRSMQAGISEFLCVRPPVEGTSKRYSVKKTQLVLYWKERHGRGW